MLLTLKGQVQFSTGKKIVFDHSFSRGMTTITGPNESGKSLRLEMIRYALFGTKALRSTATSYQLIEVTMEYLIEQDSFKVVRTKAETSLYKNGNKVATGATPVNNAIIKSLGYNIEVFDVANACLQDDVTAMTKKTPAERKKMIDKTLGLDALDVLIKSTVEKIAMEKSKISLIEGQLKNLIVYVPETPNGYESSESLENQMATLISKSKTKASLVAQLEAARCELPVETFTGNIPEDTIEVLLDKQSKSRAAQIALSNIQKEIQKAEEAVEKALSIQEVNTMKEYLDKNIEEEWNKYNTYLIDCSHADQSKYTPMELDLLYLGLEHAATIEAIEQLKLNKNVKCPHCEGEFSLAQDHIDTLENTLPISSRAGYNFWIKEGKLNSKQIGNYKSALEIKTSLSISGEVKQPEIAYIGTASSVQARLDMNKVYEDRMAGLADLVLQKNQVQAQILPNIDQDVSDRQKWDRFYNTILDQEAKHASYLELKAKLEPMIASYGDLDKEISELFSFTAICRNYEAAFSNYQTLSKIQQELTKSKYEAEAELERQTNIKMALSELKPKVKSYLVPSLSAVASNFLSKMTNNVRNRIDISDEFDITVDGQAVETLSGSGKSVANIAVRLALGTVLTNKIFSVFMADEIDAAMDSSRAEFTATCLKELASVFNQIILISHKKPDADNYIQL